MVKTRIEVFPDIPALIDFFEAVPEYDVSMYTHKKMKTNPEISLEVLNKSYRFWKVLTIIQTIRCMNCSAVLQRKTAIKTDRSSGLYAPPFPASR